MFTSQSGQPDVVVVPPPLSTPQHAQTFSISNCISSSKVSGAHSFKSKHDISYVSTLNLSKSVQSSVANL